MNIFHRITLCSLKKNKTRTVVTIIGVILSAAMIMAITTFLVSLQSFMVEQTMLKNGAWHGEVCNLPAEKQEELRGKEEIDKVSVVENVGYAKLKEPVNQMTGYLNISGFNSDSYDLAPVRITSGRLPENETELVIPENLISDFDGQYELGDKLALEVGERRANGGLLFQADPVKQDENGNYLEKFQVKFKRTYTVVGTCKRIGFDNYGAPGYTVVTKASKTPDTLRAFFSMKKPKGIFDFLKANYSDYKTTAHYELLMYIGVSDNIAFNEELYVIASILILIVALGSISLIYNAFSISVSERTKQFGLLSSIGATKKQVKKTIFFEGFAVSLIGIPLGILSGIAGAAITLKALEGSFNMLLNEVESSVAVRVSLPAVLIAAVIAFITVMISALIPAKRASKVTPIEAIRQTNDVKVGKKNVKASWIVRKIFGVEGIIASKNFKRNRKKYRSTVISLTMSIVLFIAASSFTGYFAKMLDVSVGSYNFDIMYSMSGASDKANTIYESFKSVEGVTKAANGLVIETESEIAGSRLENAEEELISNADKNLYSLYSSILFIPDDEFIEYAKSERMNPDDYFNGDLKAIAYDVTKSRRSDGKYEEKSRINDHKNPVRLSPVELDLDKGKAVTADFAKSYPYAANSFSSNLVLIMPESQIGKYKDIARMYMQFDSSDSKVSCGQMNEILEKNGLGNTSVYSIAEMFEMQKALFGIVNVFSFGFIILISLISVANVFNTISTNIHLRRREFAMLRSVGMTNMGFNKIMFIECIFYGVKSVVYGLTISAALSFLMAKIISSSIAVPFSMPWGGMAIAVLSVFIVVLITMLYAMRKVKKQNTIETIKDDNL